MGLYWVFIGIILGYIGTPKGPKVVHLKGCLNMAAIRSLHEPMYAQGFLNGQGHNLGGIYDPETFDGHRGGASK